jgi:RNA polymerase sigma-70 factor, ECF subfamily
VPYGLLKGRYGLARGDLDAALAAARRGRESGFAELWHTLQPAVLRYLKAVVGNSAAEVASQTWLQAAGEVRGYHGDAEGFRVWLFRAARHHALEELRKPARRAEDCGGVASAAEWPDVPENWAVEQENTERALRLIARLPKDQAEVVLLRVVAGLDVSQTARVLDQRDEAVRVAAIGGLRTLALIVADEQSAGDVGDSGSGGGEGLGT